MKVAGYYSLKWNANHIVMYTCLGIVLKYFSCNNKLNFTIKHGNDHTRVRRTHDYCAIQLLSIYWSLNIQTISISVIKDLNHLLVIKPIIIYVKVTKYKTKTW